MRTAGQHVLSPAVFLDRDGILNEIIIRGTVVASPRSISEFRLKPGAKELIDASRAAGYLCIVVTNQPDLERNLLKWSELEEMHRLIVRELAPDAIEVCPADSSSDRRKKPNPGMILDAAERFGVDLTRSWIVGDSDKDIGAGRAAGLRTVLLATDYNLSIWQSADFTLHSLSEIAQFIQTHSTS